MIHPIKHRLFALLCAGALLFVAGPASAEEAEGPDGHIPAEGLTVVDGILVASKACPLGADYHPLPGVTDQLHLLPSAQAAYDEMAAAAQAEAGIPLYIQSAYRSYEMQVGLFQRYAARSGTAAAERYSARPGYSEHQTGLCADIGDRRNPGITLEPAFGNTAAGVWLREQAWRFGWIIRYPKGKEHITGYQYEPWHLRYIGKDAARAFAGRPELTLEEYLGLTKEGPTAVASPAIGALEINGEERPLAGYLIRDMHYYQLRPFLAMLADTDAATAVDYDQTSHTIRLSRAERSPLVASAPPAASDAKRRALVQSAPFMRDGVPVAIRAWAVDDLSYVNLRDLGKAIGFDVDWDPAAKRIRLRTLPRTEAPTPDALDALHAVFHPIDAFGAQCPADAATPLEKDETHA